jgi:SOS-response transcriptional repressor LexA
MATILTPSRGEYSVLKLCLPGASPEPYGILLLDPASDRVWQRSREVPECEDADLLELLPGDFRAKAREMGGQALLALFEDSLSNTLRITDRRGVLVRDFEAAAGRRFAAYVEGKRPARRGGTIPLYSLRAAAGRFGQDMEVEPEERVAAPPGVRPGPDLYAVHIVGHSMEPDIPDGAVAVFRYAPAGSRQGKRVLVWRRGASAGGGEFTIKVYESVKTVTEEGWQHTRIRLRPLNPEYPVLDLEDESEYRVLGELAGLLAIDEL